ncbi:MAG TPA: hypothetical protein VGO61_04625 [Steroidobacteraceae bacterium]|jgi:hypothetical protein|nr:hypothetical protein [Steroidobacteraceae bacterium]
MHKQMLFAVLLATFGTASAADLVIHEWGTITTIHDAAGVPAVGLNRIDESEVLPDFVHRYEPEATRDKPDLVLGKRPYIPGRPDVTMRLETPVIYFHPPAGKSFDTPIDIKVRFRGGVLNEYFPEASATVALDSERLQDKQEAGVIKPWNGVKLDNYVVGTLQWKGLRLHDTVVAPLTNNPIWLAPREVNSVSVFDPAAGEGEQYIFYRGVAHLDALLQTRLAHGQLRLLAPTNLLWLDAAAATLPGVWLADVRADGSVAFREHGAITLRKDAAGKEVAALKRFSAGDYHDAAALRGSLKRALIAQGLFADEAEAMLNTWKLSYFRKPGLRVFYIVPREWTDYFLPLEFSVPARVNRVIVGRIDLQP